MSKLIFSILTGVALGLLPASAQVFPGSQGANRAASGAYSLRNLALGELRFSNDQLYNLYDQGGSPMGLLETHPERMGVTLGLLSNDRVTNGDSLKLGNHDYYLPQLGFFQPGVFGAILYFQRETEVYQRIGGDSVDLAASRFGLDLAAGPASGIFRFGFSAHARMGGIEYSGDAKRILVEIPSLRFDIGSRVMPGLEIGAFAGFGGRFDSLESPVKDLERAAVVNFPRFGVVADVGGLEAIPLKGNLALEFGTERSFGEYKPAITTVGVEYPIIWNSYWSLQTQFMYPIPAGDFVIEPALSFAHRSDDAQGYLGIKGNQNPFKKGDKIAAMKGTRSVTAYGLGSHFSFREMVSLWLEWETAGHAYDTDSLRKETYNRFAVGLEHQVEKLPVMKFPEGMNLALRAGWSFRQEPKDAPGYRDYHFDPFIPDASVPSAAAWAGAQGAPAAYTALHFGMALGLLRDQVGLEGMVGLPGQLERFTPTRTSEASGMEFGLTARYRILK